MAVHDGGQGRLPEMAFLAAPARLRRAVGAQRPEPRDPTRAPCPAIVRGRPRRVPGTDPTAMPGAHGGIGRLKAMSPGALPASLLGGVLDLGTEPGQTDGLRGRCEERRRLAAVTRAVRAARAAPQDPEARVENVPLGAAPGCFLVHPHHARAGPGHGASARQRVEVGRGFARPGSAPRTPVSLRHGADHALPHMTVSAAPAAGQLAVGLERPEPGQARRAASLAVVCGRRGAITRARWTPVALLNGVVGCLEDMALWAAPASLDASGGGHRPDPGEVMLTREPLVVEAGLGRPMAAMRAARSLLEGRVASGEDVALGATPTREHACRRHLGTAPREAALMGQGRIVRGRFGHATCANRAALDRLDVVIGALEDVTGPATAPGRQALRSGRLRAEPHEAPIAGQSSVVLGLLATRHS